MGTALALSESETDIHLKAQSYRIPSEAVDGMDVVAVEAAARRAVAAIRDSGGPRLLEFRTYRFRAHSMYDPQLYRTKAEVESWTQHDPITRFRDWSIAAGELRETDVTAIEEDVAREVEDAIVFAEAADWEPIADLMKHVGAELRR
jgi:TPP-dependent pyruvate/acetoin dehydrogenase alpha subunit